jgi:phosphoribosylformimino-5-aminoimidazole carboxamide ribotide isomerase
VSVQVAGGIRSAADFEEVAGLGASQVVMGTAAASAPELIEAIASAHEGKLVVAADVRDGQVVIRGWTEGSGLSLEELVERATVPGMGGLLVTDVSRDGLLAGPNVALYRDLVAMTELAVLASGGVRDQADVDALAETGVAGVVVGTAMYEGRLTLAPPSP